ncbi:hypothetical protein [uncultured Nocardioides sp.]|uniref:hypothetical protein n=1 Tax=uncultured Nocardioides sp. TaxID=198441 RepID=UPI00260CA307|nr:hypothetical protein [uncultured Nocardioides sp.]
MGPTSSDRLAEAVETAALVGRRQRQLARARDTGQAREREVTASRTVIADERVHVLER